jgi:hypothetical protein
MTLRFLVKFAGGETAERPYVEVRHLAALDTYLEQQPALKARLGKQPKH